MQLTNGSSRGNATPPPPDTPLPQGQQLTSKWIFKHNKPTNTLSYDQQGADRLSEELVKNALDAPPQEAEVSAPPW